jgi:hypothetical protein
LYDFSGTHKVHVFIILERAVDELYETVEVAVLLLLEPNASDFGLRVADVWYDLGHVCDDELFEPVGVQVVQHRRFVVVVRAQEVVTHELCYSFGAFVEAAVAFPNFQALLFFLILVINFNHIYILK